MQINRIIRRIAGPARYLLLVTVTLLAACDSSDDVAVKTVNSEARISDEELQQQDRSTQPPSDSTVERDVYYFGFDLRGSPQEDAAQYLPFLTYLEKSTGYKFKLHFTPKDSSTIEELGMDNTQFAAMGANGFLQAQLQYGARAIVRGLNQLGRAEYQSVLVVRPDSDIDDIRDIEGKSFAFGSSDSTQGHLIPRIILNDNGISLDELRVFEYTGSHQNCAESVVSGKFDVCGMQDTLGKSLADQGMVKILHTSRYYPSSGIVANKNVPEEVIDRVKKAMLDFRPEGEHQAGLYNWD